MLSLLFGLGLLLRLAGLAYGLPEVFHPDEGTSIGEALGLLRGATDALTFANPPLYKYVLAGLFAGMVGPQRLAAIDPSVLYLIARGVSAVAGALTVLAVYWLGRLLHGTATGLLAAGLAAITYLLVRESHFGVNDALATLCTTLGLVACVRVAQRGRRLDYLAAGAALGLAFAAKYQCAALLVPWLIAHLQHGRRRHDRDLLWGLATALLVAVVAFPPLVTETRRVIADVYVFLMLPSRLGFEGLDPAGGYVFYFKSFGWGIGWPMLALAGAGSVVACCRRAWPLLVVASLPVCLYLAMGSSHMYVARFMLPGLPAMISLVAVVLDEVRRRSWLGCGLLSALVLAGTLPASVQFDALLTRIDTRTEARDWIGANLPPGAHVLADPPVFGPSLDGLPLQLTIPQGHAMYDLPLDDYRAQGIQYVVTSSFIAEAPNLDPSRTARRQQFYAALNHDAERVAEFRPDTGGAPAFVYDRIYGPFDSLDQFTRPGPTIQVFNLGAG